MICYQRVIGPLASLFNDLRALLNQFFYVAFKNFGGNSIKVFIISKPLSHCPLAKKTFATFRR